MLKWYQKDCTFKISTLQQKTLQKLQDKEHGQISVCHLTKKEMENPIT